MAGKRKVHEGRYFVFGVNSPCSRMVSGDDSQRDTCVIFQKIGDLLVPAGDDSKRWARLQTDVTPWRKNAIKFFKRKKIREVLTTDIPYPRNELWGLENTFAPEGWDYDEDPWPPAEVSFAIGERPGIYYLDHEETIRVRYVIPNVAV